MQCWQVVGRFTLKIHPGSINVLNKCGGQGFLVLIQYSRGAEICATLWIMNGGMSFKDVWALLKILGCTASSHYVSTKTGLHFVPPVNSTTEGWCSKILYTCINNRVKGGFNEVLKNNKKMTGAYFENNNFHLCSACHSELTEWCQKQCEYILTLIRTSPLSFTTFSKIWILCLQWRPSLRS